MRGNLTLFVSFFISTYIVCGSSDGKMLGSKPETINRVAIDLTTDNRESFCRMQIRLEETVTVFGIYLSCQMAEVILYRTFFNTTIYFAFSEIMRQYRPDEGGSGR